MPLQAWFDLQERKKHDWHAIERAWKDALPEWENRSGLSPAILSHLKELEEQGLVAFPKGRDKWSPGVPSCPLWCVYKPAATSKEKAVYPGPWHARLGFNTQYRDDTLELLWQINTFLLNSDRFEHLAPLKERSLQICGDEKRLDAFRIGSNTHLFKGQLALSDIGAFHAEAPLAYEVYDEGSTRLGLILENQDSYYSFRVWNKKILRYRAIVYGAGNAFSSSYRNLAALQEEHGIDTFEYLGDVDYTGFQIPERVAAALPLGTLYPALGWYRWLLQQGVRRSAKEKLAGQMLSSWLSDPHLREEIAALWASGLWIPQESLGLDVLMSFSETN